MNGNEESRYSLKIDFCILKLHEKEKIKFLKTSLRKKLILLMSINSES